MGGGGHTFSSENTVLVKFAYLFGLKCCFSFRGKYLRLKHSNKIDKVHFLCMMRVLFFMSYSFGSHFVYPIGKMLAISDPLFALILPTKFRINWPWCLGEVVI